MAHLGFGEGDTPFANVHSNLAFVAAIYYSQNLVALMDIIARNARDPFVRKLRNLAQLLSIK